VYVPPSALKLMPDMKVCVLKDKKELRSAVKRHLLFP
jgi:hypothetical protein